MKLAFLTGLALGACLVVQAAEPAPITSTNATITPLASAEGTEYLKTEEEKFSYSIGLNYARLAKRQNLNISTNALLRGMQDGLADKTPLMTDPEMTAVQGEMQKVIRARIDKLNAEMKTNNLAAAEKFLAENATKEGVKKFASGVQYKSLAQGSGPKPVATDKVGVRYKARLLNGKEFDSSYKRGPEPVTMSLANLQVKGWAEAITNMNVGSKWEVYVPPALAYGERGQRETVEPNSLLIFETELVEIKLPEPAPATSQPPQPITSDIIRVPSKAELDAGGKIEVIKQEDLHKYTNAPAKGGTNAAAPAKPATAPK